MRDSQKENAIAEDFSKKKINLKLFCYDEVESTMDAAADEIKKNSLTDTAVIMANRQTKGRGRQSRSWESVEGNFFATFSFPLKAELKVYSGFSLVAGLAVNAALSQLGCRTRLKWPNDILSLNNKKLGGILIEIVEHGNKKYMLCGIGINLIQTPAQIENTISIKEICDQAFTPSQILIKLAPIVEKHFDKFSQSGFAPFKADWMLNAAYIGREVSVHVAGSKKLSGMLMGVLNDGTLQLEREGKFENISAGDLSLAESQ